MKVFAVLLLVCSLLALAFAVPDKRFLLDDLEKEAAKILTCEAKLQQGPCEECCSSTVWFHPAEASACKTACAILP